MEKQDLNESSCDIINPGLLEACRNFVKHALDFLSPKIGFEIGLDVIQTKPKTERERLYRLLNPEPQFYSAILNYKAELEKFPEFIKYDRIMHEDPVLSKHLDTLVVGGTSGTRMESHMYIFFVLDKMINKYYSSGNYIFDDNLFDSLYCDMEYLFYNDDLPFKVIAPLHLFGSKIDTIDLGEGLVIKKITVSDKNTFSRVTGGLSLTSVNVSELEYMIEYSFKQKKGIGYTAKVSYNEQALSLLKKLLTVMRLFKRGSVGSSFTVWKPMLKTALMGGGALSTSPPEVTYGTKYDLDEGEVSSFKDFWRMEKWNRLGTTSNKNLNLALRRFSSAYSRHSNDDKLIDSVIACEALLSKGGSDADSLTYKFALRFSRLVENHYEKRKEYFDGMRDLYGKRSKVAHGDPTSVTTADAEKIEEYLRKAINVYMDRIVAGVDHNEIIDKIDLG